MPALAPVSQADVVCLSVLTFVALKVDSGDSSGSLEVDRGVPSRSLEGEGESDWENTEGSASFLR